MKGRVTWDGKYSGMSLDWLEHVDNPLSQGYFIESFSSADALIDSEIKSILRQIYSSTVSQILINNLESTRDEINFFGSGILRILENLKVIDKKLGNKIRDFKGKRNKVSHNIYAEYSLLNPVGLKNQAEYDDAVEKEAKRCIGVGFEIFEKLIEVSKKLCEEFKAMSENDKANWLIKRKKRA